MALTQTTTLITAFEVPPDADESFTAGWEQARDGRATLHRALREDADFRFVAVAQADAAAGPGAVGSFASHHGAYEVVREDRAPDGEGGVVLINPFEVPDGDDERFLSGWDAARDALVQQRGYLGTRLHRSVAPADFRFVNVARWSSPLMFARALEQPAFRAAAQAIPFPAHPALYLVVAGA
ncbi:MAG TPA: antibiotic biosynthesis monooxygenase family protein [Solirubrobacteraceae bacterium]|nr:antibiotic biosynthesis monooxygenase family protein [Solirubrobacteraceae bacterium]